MAVYDGSEIEQQSYRGIKPSMTWRYLFLELYQQNDIGFVWICIPPIKSWTLKQDLKKKKKKNDFGCVWICLNISRTQNHGLIDMFPRRIAIWG